jgi:hypothetical protein
MSDLLHMRAFGSCPELAPTVARVTRMFARVGSIAASANQFHYDSCNKI